MEKPINHSILVFLMSLIFLFSGCTKIGTIEYTTYEHDMEPVINWGDVVKVEKRFDYKRGDILLYNEHIFKDKLHINRLIAMQDDTLMMAKNLDNFIRFKEKPLVNPEKDRELMLKLAREIRKEVNNGADFAAIGERYSKMYPLNIFHTTDYGFKDDIESEYFPALDELKPGELYKNTISTKIIHDGNSEATIEILPGINLVKLISAEMTHLEGMEPEKEYQFERIFLCEMPLVEWIDTGFNLKYIQSAEIQYDVQNKPYVLLKFTEEGKKAFERLTARNTNRPIEVYVGPKLVYSQIINDNISDGQFELKGDFTQEKAEKIVKEINSAISGYKEIKESKEYSNPSTILIIKSDSDKIEILDEPYLTNEMKNVINEDLNKHFEHLTLYENTLLLMSDDRQRENEKIQFEIIENEDVIGVVIK